MDRSEKTGFGDIGDRQEHHECQYPGGFRTPCRQQCHAAANRVGPETQRKKQPRNPQFVNHIQIAVVRLPEPAVQILCHPGGRAARAKPERLKAGPQPGMFHDFGIHEPPDFQAPGKRHIATDRVCHRRNDIAPTGHAVGNKHDEADADDDRRERKHTSQEQPA
jgi:hypothetical protein